MPKQTVKRMSWLQTNTVRIARLHFVYVFTFAASVIAYDAWKLITSQALLQRWSVAVAMLITTTTIWFIARNSARTATVYRSLILVLVLMDIMVAGYSVYSGRGMASRGVALFAIPIIVSGVILSRSALFATASLCVGVYSYAAIKYFTDNPSEGYKVELYGDLFFYGACFFIFSALLWVVVRSVQPRSS
ncbi:hypothetical protein H0X10_00095 [Candidatus Saccharibacteria bacterium]|nr:hypothetical protein [Candidatus Saccharibacteria bacterium]